MRDCSSNDSNGELMDDNRDDYLELAESNMDWSATAAIYVEESKVFPLTASLSSNKNTFGFYGRVQLTLHTAATSLAFCHKATEDNQHRYFALSKPPILDIQFMYCYNNNYHDANQEDDDENELLLDSSTTMPSQVHLAWEYYPTELPELEESTVLSWLTQKCQTKLQEEKELMTMCASFSIVEVCEHELWSYWETLHNSNNGFRLILLPPKMDLLYHSNIGILVDPRKEALKGNIRTKPQSNGSSSSSSPKDALLKYAKQALIQCWTKLYVDKCPICFDVVRSDKGITLPCGHFFCQDCFPLYLKTKVTELAGYRTNPFLCPMEKCRAELSIEQTVKSYISPAEYKQVQRWQRDLVHPICYSLDRCLSKACTEATTKLIENQEYEAEDVCMRNRSKDAKNTFVFCEVCDKTWCELCLKRIPSGVTPKEHRAICESKTAIKFCRRYLRATDEVKAICETKYPWIAIYAVSRQHDGEALNWILEHGQICPNCSTGVERSEGCFHMKCTQCATHFCYECGQEIFPPYYGTHHCWEEDNGIFHDQFQ